MGLSSCGGSSTGPGQAVVAEGPLVCCVMRRADFERLLGPYDELWRYEALRKVRHTGSKCVTLLHRVLHCVAITYVSLRGC
jgi:hypothetical protein